MASAAAAVGTPRTAATASTATPEDLEVLAKSILSDSKLAERLAEMPEAAALIRTAGMEKHAFQDDTHKDPWDVFGDPEKRLSQASPITSWRLQLYFWHHYIPFVGFGFMDNAIMLIMGDWIDSSLGMTFGITTMCAAAIGNTFSDVIGLWVSGFIETICAFLGMPDHEISHEQQQMLYLRIFKNTSMVVGIVTGCGLGMFPLVYPEEWRLWPKAPKVEPDQECGRR